MPSDIDLVKEAIIETEKEIFGDAFGKEDMTLDASGDRSLEEMGAGLEGQHEPDEDDGEADADGENPEVDAKTEGESGKSDEAEGKGKQPDPEANADDGKGKDGRVPSGRVREANERARAAEAERDALKQQFEAQKAESQKAIDALNARFDALMRAQQQTQQPRVEPAKTEPETPPDIFEDPKGFAEYLQKGPKSALEQMERRFEEMRINNSMSMARVKHGETFDAAFQAFVEAGKSGDPEARVLGQRILKSSDPGEGVVQWHRRNETLRRVGSDPDAYEAKIKEDATKALMQDPNFRKQVIDELRAEAETGDNGRPRTTVKLPPSLNRAAGNNRSMAGDRSAFDGSDSAIFDSAFNST
ncbi:MAG TPA: hypothetical protein VN039_03170 [Nitrospira sp.]|nr:hypothetical protein [Nitrospira sp.]